MKDFKVEINLGPIKIEFGHKNPAEVDLSGLSPEVIEGIQKSQKEGEDFNGAATRLLANGMFIEVERLEGNDILAKSPDGKTEDLFEITKRGDLLPKVKKDK